MELGGRHGELLCPAPVNCRPHRKRGALDLDVDTVLLPQQVEGRFLPLLARSQPVRAKSQLSQREATKL